MGPYLSIREQGKCNYEVFPRIQSFAFTNQVVLVVQPSTITGWETDRRLVSKNVLFRFEGILTLCMDSKDPHEFDKQ